MFRDVSIMGRVIYIIYAIEVYLKENDDSDKWNILLNALWSYPEYEGCIDDYAYKVIECTPETVLDEREDFKTFEYFSDFQLQELKRLYMESEYTESLNHLMEKMNDILGYNLYTSVKAPEIYSLKIVNDTYQYIEHLLGEKTPLTEPFEVYSIYDRRCWGDYTLGKEALLERMRSTTVV